MFSGNEVSASFSNPQQAPQSGNAPEEVLPALHVIPAADPHENGAVNRPELRLRAEDVPIYFIFRKNGIYENYLEQIKDRFVDQGRKIEIIAFPQQTDPISMREALRRYDLPYHDIVLFTDRTTASVLPKGTEFPGLAQRSIDSIFCGCGLSVVCRELGITTLFEVEVEETPGVGFLKSYLEAHAQRFKSVLSHAFQAHKPDMIIIDSRCMNEHVPFHILGGDDADRKAAELVRRWILDAGHPVDKVMLVDDMSQLDPKGFSECSSIWFIGDRHWQDKSSGQREIHHFVRRVERAQRSQLIDDILRDAHIDTSEMEAEQQGRDMPWDGDDGIDALDRIDLDISDESVNAAQESAESVHEGQGLIEGAFVHLPAWSEREIKVSVRFLPLPMDSLLESMIAQDMLPIDHAKQGANFVALACETLNFTIPKLAAKVAA